MSVKKCKVQDHLFATACNLAKTPNAIHGLQTERQYKKWQKGEGLAFNKRAEAKQILNMK